jgi:hypothetical protein
MAICETAPTPWGWTSHALIRDPWDQAPYGSRVRPHVDLYCWLFCLSLLTRASCSAIEAPWAASAAVRPW